MRASLAANGSNAATRLPDSATPSDRGGVRLPKVNSAPSRRGLALAAAVLTLALGTGAAAVAGLAHSGRDASSAALALRTAGVRGALDTTFQRYADTIHDLAAAATTERTADLTPLVSRIADKRLPGAHQVVILGADRSVRARHTLDGTAPPPRTRLDPEPELAHALDLARDTGRLVATPAHVLPADRDLPPAHRQPAFELAAPVHDGEFRGWVLIGVRAPDLLQESLRAAGITGVTALLTETSPDGVTREVARWADGGTPTGDRTGTVDVALAGHTWQVLVRPAATAGTTTVPLTVVVTILISVLLAATVLVLDARRVRAAARARRTDAEHRDTLDRHRAAEERLRARADAAELTLREQEAELTGFAAAAAEHLHAPLHTIAGFTDLLREETGPQLDPETRGFLDRIGGSTQRMLVLVDELLAYSSAADAALKPEPVDAGLLALGVVAGCLDHGDGERPSIDLGELPDVTADAELFGEVLGHLIGNATRFVRHGTAARITLAAREHSPGWWRFEVADRGIGVPEEQRTRIFAPFHRTPAAEGFPGAGLGLAVARRIVALHGGEIGVEPNPGGGSIFWFTVPAAADVTPVAGHELLGADLA
jgi:signal transduction histidine kinase